MSPLEQELIEALDALVNAVQLWNADDEPRTVTLAIVDAEYVLNRERV